MKTILVIVSILIFSVTLTTSEITNFFKHSRPPPTGPKRNITVGEIYMSSFSQKLDHFNETDTRFWKQRFYLSTENFDDVNRNVVFLMLGGEEEISSNWMMYGSWVVSAKKYGALLFYLEHRYYGESQPFADLSTENLRYLRSDLALADATAFIKSMNQVYSLAPDVKWIVFGGSYSGALAAWLRLKQPDLVYGAVCSSGPLLAKLDFSEYFQVIIDDMASSSQQCVDSLKTAMAQVDDLIANPTPDESVSTIFNLCEPIEGLEMNDIRVVNFYRFLAGFFINAAQYNGQQNVNVDDICAILSYEEAGKEIVRLANVKKLVDGVGCLNYNYLSYVNALQDVTKRTGDARQWFYQTCSEFGWFQTSSREDRMFGQGCPIGYFPQLCTDVFGPWYTEENMSLEIDLTNANYGGLDIDASNVIYIYGSFDPWHTVGITETTNPNISAIYVEGMSHCADMYEATAPESPQLTAAKKEVDRLIGVWLGY